MNILFYAYLAFFLFIFPVSAYLLLEKNKQPLHGGTVSQHGGLGVGDGFFLESLGQGHRRILLFFILVATRVL